MVSNNKPAVILRTKFSYPMANAVTELLPECVGRLREQYPADCNVGDLTFQAVDVNVHQFNSGEYKATSPHLVDREVYLFHDVLVNGEYRPNDFVAIAMALDDSVRNAEPRRITHVAPHIPYQRQEREYAEHESVTAKRVMRSCFYDPESPIPTRMFTFDMHNPAAAKFAPYRVKELYASPLFIKRFRHANCVLVAPDAAAGKRLEAVAKRMGNKDLAIVYKTRPEEGIAVSHGIMGIENFEGKDLAITIDDMIDTGGSNEEAIQQIRCVSPNIKIVAAATHGLFSYDRKKQRRAEDVLRKNDIKVVVTDAVRKTDGYLAENSDWLEVEPIAPILAEAIARRELGLKVSDMFL